MLSDVKPAKHKSGCFPTLWTWELCSCSFLLYAALAKIYRQVMKRFRKGVSSALLWKSQVWHGCSHRKAFVCDVGNHFAWGLAEERRVSFSCIFENCAPNLSDHFHLKLQVSENKGYSLWEFFCLQVYLWFFPQDFEVGDEQSTEDFIIKTNKTPCWSV